MSESEEQREMTYGEKAVGLTFNPGGSAAVTTIKVAYAMLIDDLNEIRQGSDDPEVKRMASVAITEAQTSQMWAVKAITWAY